MGGSNIVAKGRSSSPERDYRDLDFLPLSITRFKSNSKYGSSITDSHAGDISPGRNGKLIVSFRQSDQTRQKAD